jgi:RimJ/RimL family protein N-acetyltransferase
MPTLTGRLVRLRPLTDQDAEALFASITSEEVWAWKPEPQPRTVEAMRALIARVMIGPTGGRHPLVVLRLSDDAVIGSTSLYTIDPRHRSAEIGWTWLDRRLWGQGYNEDMKHVLLEHCFGQLGLCRVQFTADASNLRSQRALERLGFVREGVLRSHRVRVDRTRSDTAVYSVLSEDWPATAARLDHLIDRRQPRVPPRAPQALRCGTPSPSTGM